MGKAGKQLIKAIGEVAASLKCEHRWSKEKPSLGGTFLLKKCKRCKITMMTKISPPSPRTEEKG